MEAYLAAHATLMSAERELSAAKSEQYAVPLDFPVKWDAGVPLPHLFVNDYRTYLTFYVAEPDPNWDGRHVKVKDPGSGLTELLALVEFKRCRCARLGVPNDEVLKDILFRARAGGLHSSVGKELSVACRNRGNQQGA